MADKKNVIAEEMPEESLEELFAKLDQVAKELESGDTSLEESFGLYQKGMEMLKLCNGRRKETPPNADAGDIPPFRRRRKRNRAVYGSNGDDPYLFPGAR